MQVYICVWIYTHTHTHTHMYIYILQFTYTHIYRHICMYTNIHVYLHTGFRANSALVWTIGQPSFARHLSQNGGHTRCPHGAKAIAVGPNTSKHTGHGRSPALSSCLCNAGFETAWNGELPSCTACESGTYKAAPGSESACTLCEGALPHSTSAVDSGSASCVCRAGLRNWSWGFTAPECNGPLPPRGHTC